MTTKLKTKVTFDCPRISTLLRWLEWMEKNVGKPLADWDFSYSDSTFDTVDFLFADEEKATMFCMFCAWVDNDRNPMLY